MENRIIYCVNKPVQASDLQAPLPPNYFVDIRRGELFPFILKETTEPYDVWTQIYQNA